MNEPRSEDYCRELHYQPLKSAFVNSSFRTSAYPRFRCTGERRPHFQQEAVASRRFPSFCRNSRNGLGRFWIRILLNNLPRSPNCLSPYTTNILSSLYGRAGTIMYVRQSEQGSPHSSFHEAGLSILVAARASCGRCPIAVLRYHNGDW